MLNSFFKSSAIKRAAPFKYFIGVSRNAWGKDGKYQLN